ncbi:zinc-ribbon domain-containing protein [Candidatus Riflebacteria bacterium]
MRLITIILFSLFFWTTNVWALFCFNCGKKITTEAKFCPNCGKKQRRGGDSSASNLNSNSEFFKNFEVIDDYEIVLSTTNYLTAIAKTPDFAIKLKNNLNKLENIRLNKTQNYLKNLYITKKSYLDNYLRAWQRSITNLNLKRFYVSLFKDQMKSDYQDIKNINVVINFVKNHFDEPDVTNKANELFNQLKIIKEENLSEGYIEYNISELIVERLKTERGFARKKRLIKKDRIKKQKYKIYTVNSTWIKLEDTLPYLLQDFNNLYIDKGDKFRVLDNRFDYILIQKIKDGRSGWVGEQKLKESTDWR